jgi:hypothetical protein
MCRNVRERIEKGRNVIGTNCGGRIVKDEMSCTEVNGHRPGVLVNDVPLTGVLVDDVPLTRGVG